MTIKITTYTHATCPLGGVIGRGAYAHLDGLQHAILGVQPDQPKQHNYVCAVTGYRSTLDYMETNRVGTANTKKEIWDIIYPLFEQGKSFVINFDDKSMIDFDYYGPRGGSRSIGSRIKEAKSFINSYFNSGLNSNGKIAF